MNKTDIPNSIEQGKGNSRTIQATFDRIALFLGEWTGRGNSIFPTIDKFDYSETFCVQRSKDASFLTYEQLTDLIGEGGRVIHNSHWEAVILKPREDGSIELVCVQGNGRVEILRGKCLEQESQPSSITLSFKSELIGNDEQVIRSSWDWKLAGDRFSYVMNMATMKVPEPRQHLEAGLIKSSCRNSLFG